jgi:hypothetical protein
MAVDTVTQLEGLQLAVEEAVKLVLVAMLPVEFLSVVRLHLEVTATR